MKKTYIYPQTDLYVLEPGYRMMDDWECSPPAEWIPGDGTAQGSELQNIWRNPLISK